MSSNDLLARYLQAVGFWLPRATRHDILAEISEDLQSQIEDRSAGLNRSLNDAEIADILKQRGRPMIVASSYLPHQSLIGPILFPSYKLTLKIAYLCYVIPWLLVWMGFLIFAPHHINHPSGSSLAHSLLPLWLTALNIFAGVTLIFYGLDRGLSMNKFADDWDPKQLPRLRAVQPRRRAEDIAAIVFGILALVWLLAVPNFPFLILGPGAFLVKAAPVWQIVYPWILVLAVAGIVEHIASLLRNLPPWLRPAFKIATTGLSLGVVFALLRTRTYLLPKGMQTAPWISAVNLVVYICLACSMVGLFIALIVHAWRTLQALKSNSLSSLARLA
jgi:hypothetical protein